MKNSARSISGNVCLFPETNADFGDNSVWIHFDCPGVDCLSGRVGRQSHAREFLAFAGRGEDDGPRYPLEEANAALAHLLSGRPGGCGLADSVELPDCESEPWFA